MTAYIRKDKNLSSHDLAKLLLSRPDGTVHVLEEVRGHYERYTSQISIRIAETDIFADGTVYGHGIEIDKDGDVFLGER